MKKFLSILTLVFAVFISLTSIVGCGESQHEHQYVNGKCSCGAAENLHEHQYENGICSCGDIKWEELLTKETLSNVTITTQEDLRIYRRQPIGSFPWFGNESGTSNETRTVKIADGLVEERFCIIFQSKEDEILDERPVLQEGVFKGEEMSISTHDGSRPQWDEQLSNFERHFDIITNVLTMSEFTYDEQEQLYVGREYMFKMTNKCCDSIDAHEVKFKIENGRVTYLYFDIYINSHDTVSTWNCEMKSTFIFSDYGTTVIE